MESNARKNTALTIGRLANVTGVNVTTIRYYQKLRLLRQPERPSSGGFRSYNQQDQERLFLIKQAQALGFSLAEISDLITYFEEKDYCAIEALAAKKLNTIGHQIQILENMHRTLSALTLGCPHDGWESCSLVQSLAPSLAAGDPAKSDPLLPPSP